MKARWIILSALLCLAGCLLIPDDEEKGTRVENLRPRVQITAGAAGGDSSGTDYKVRFQWRGSDDDGVVLRFQYAMDDTTSERAWQDTTGFSTLLKFGATHPSQQDPDGTFNDWHTFYIRAIDNEYAMSPIDSRYFNAKTIAPKAKITFPKVTGLAFVKTFAIDWEGEDIDSSDPSQEPAFYEYKLIRLTSAFVPEAQVPESLRVMRNNFLDTLVAGDRTRWIRVPGDTKTRVLRDLPDTGSEVFVFGVRAIDEAGAVEPVLQKGENWIQFQIQDKAAQPIVTVFERSIGSHVFPADGPVWSIEVPTNSPIRFRWEGDASYYGSKPGSVNYGLDIPDPADERYRDPRGIGGWIGWGNYDQVVSPIIFPDSEDGQTHFFYLRMRDVSETRTSERLCTVAMKVVAFTFERTALLVDDARVGYGLGGSQQDAVHDAFVHHFIGRINDFAPQGIDEVSLYRPTLTNPEGRNPSQNEIIPLDQLARYGTILWSFNFTTGSQSGIWLHEREAHLPDFTAKRMLSSYIGAGGKFFLFGGRALSSTISLLDGGPAGGVYPKLPPQAGPANKQFDEDSFIWKFLHVRSQITGIDRPINCYSDPPYENQTWRDGLVRCVSVNPAYPDLSIDPAKYDPDRVFDCGDRDPPQGGILDFEGILFDRAYSPLFPEAGLDTVYTGIGYNWVGSAPTKWDGEVVAQRYQSTRADTLQGTQQGRVMMFLFQPWPFYEAPAVDAGTAAVNWLMTGQDY